MVSACCLGLVGWCGVGTELVERARREAVGRLTGLPLRPEHVRGVVRAAQRLRGRFDVQTGACLVALAWLHDLAMRPTVRKTGFHPCDGAELCARRVSAS